MTPEQIRQEAEREYPVIFERDFNPLSDGSLDINESAREAYIKGRMKSLEEKEKEIAAYIKVAMKVLEEKEKEIAELVDCLQETIRCCAVFKDNMLSADVTISEHCDQIEVAKQILKKHNP